MNENDWDFLKKHFQTAATQVNDDKACMQVLNRKIAHSQRVLQNGIMIMEHDLPDLAPETRTLAEQALLLHDIGRFSEVVLSYQNQAMQAWGRKYDHGRLGAEILAQTPEYNRMEIILAVRHHGHLIEDFYKDEEYQNLSPEKQATTEIIVKIVRDADKLDLYSLHQKENSLEHDVFFTNLPQELKFAPLSDEVAAQFFAGKSIKHSAIRSMSDRLLGCLSWQFDFNYPFTHRIYREKGYAENLLTLLSKYCPDKSVLEKIRKFIF